MKRVISAGIVTLILLTSRDAWAWFQVCNQRSTAMWLSYAHYLSTTNWNQGECGHETLQGDCHYSSWKTEGWWRLNPGVCWVIYNAPITNAYHYVYGEWDDGATTWDGPSFYARDAAFAFDEYVSFSAGNGECIAQHTTYTYWDPQLGYGCWPQGYWLHYMPIYTGSATNYTLNFLAG